MNKKPVSYFQKDPRWKDKPYESAREVLQEMYGSLDTYLTSRIEAEVRRRKSAAPMALPVTGELVSTVETTAEQT